MSKQATSKEEEVKTLVKQYIAAGKLPNVEINQYGSVRLVFEVFVLIIMVIGYVIRYYLSKVIPALAEPKYIVSDKVVLLTGAAGGFGRRLAEQLAAKGATVACVDVDEAANERCANAANSAAAAAGRPESKPVAFAFQANLANRKEAQKVVKEVEEKLGRVDILISAAICYSTHDIGGFDDDEIDFLVDLNFKSTIWLIRAVLPGMKKRNSGHITVFSSATAFCPAPSLSLYAACKCALKGLMNSLYFEFKDEGLDIGITTIYPYYSPTNPFIREILQTRIPFLDPDEVVRDVINAIETRELNLVVPRYMAPLAGIYGLFPKEAIGRILDIVDFRIKLSSLLMPKATITVDKWTEVYGAYRGPSGAFLKVHDHDEVTPKMIQKSSGIINKIQEKVDHGDSVTDVIEEVMKEAQNEYASKKNDSVAV